MLSLKIGKKAIAILILKDIFGFGTDFDLILQLNNARLLEQILLTKYLNAINM